MPADINKDANRIYLRFVGDLSQKDHQRWTSQLINYTDAKGRWHLLVGMTDFEGFDVATLMKEIDLDRERLDVFERVAVIADAINAPWIASFIELFKSAEVQIFEHANTKEAERWLAWAECEESTNA